jgi:hypothetical protein
MQTNQPALRTVDINDFNLQGMEPLVNENLQRIIHESDAWRSHAFTEQPGWQSQPEVGASLRRWHQVPT